MERLMLEGDEQSQWKDPRRFHAYGTLQIEFSAPSPGLPEDRMQAVVLHGGELLKEFLD
jgi:hypothetical protein